MAPVDCIQNTESSTMSTSMLSKSLPLLPSPPSTCAVPTNNFTIKTSKKWVLPPRPKPGRKPVDSDHHESITEVKKEESNSPLSVPPQIPEQKPSSSQQQQQKPKQKLHTSQQPVEKPKSKRGRKSHSEKAKQTELSNNPIKQAIMKVNEENYYLKLEVIKLVSDLKSLKYETEQLNQDPLLELNGDCPLEQQQQQQQQDQDISSVPMGYNSTSNRTNNNNTIYKINSNVSTNLSTPIMATTTSSSPLTSATTPPPTTTATHGKKRPHDDDINHLILSLIDLNHSNEVSPLTSSNLDSLHSEQIIEATVKKLNDKKKQQQQVQKQQQQNFNCTNFLNLDHIEEDELISASPNHDFIHDDNESIDVESLTPNSLLSLTKTNSTIDDIELDNHNHFSPQLIDIPEVPLPASETFTTAQHGDELHAVTDNYEFSFWKNNKDDDKLKKNFVFNTNSTLDELIMERQREREEELLNYNEFNDLIDFDNTNNKNSTLTKDEDNVSHIIFNDDWRLDDDDLLNF